MNLLKTIAVISLALSPVAIIAAIFLKSVALLGLAVALVALSFAPEIWGRKP